MSVTSGARTIAETPDHPQALYEAIGAFLSDQRLEPNPANFTFAYHVLCDPEGALAQAVCALTDGGVRLTAREIGALGGEADPTKFEMPQGAVAPPRRATSPVEGLMARTQMQVEGFADMMRSMRRETEGFGRDLAASAAAIRTRRDSPVPVGPSLLDEVAMITGSMLERVHVAEARLEQATIEATELRTKLEEARDNARRDPLTDLPNRRAFEEAFSARSTAGEPMMIAVCDVDHFKSVNDQFGHAVGDRVLKAIGTALAAGCPGHLVARYGGEEFAILFAGTTADEARAILEDVRETVAARRYRLRESDVTLGEVTFSAGLCRANEDDQCADAVQRADMLLYAAKDAGRNQIKVA